MAAKKFSFLQLPFLVVFALILLPMISGDVSICLTFDCLERPKISFCILKLVILVCKCIDNVCLCNN